MSAYINAIRYVGEGYAPQDIRRRRKQTQETMRRMGTPVLIKHMYNDEDRYNGIATTSANFDDVYKQTRNFDPLSHGVGFVSIEESENEWVAPDGRTIVVSNTSPGAGYFKAPKHRGFGPGYLVYMIQPDVAEDQFKVTESGVLIKTQSATAQAPWYPEINDNDLISNVTLGRNEQIIDTQERFQAKMTSPISMRGIDRRGRKETTEDGGNRFMVGQQFEMTLIPHSNDTLYAVEMDR